MKNLKFFSLIGSAVICMLSAAILPSYGLTHGWPFFVSMAIWVGSVIAALFISIAAQRLE